MQEQRVAIYSRKSKFTGKGDSIENQIEMCKQYISNHAKNKIQYFIYEDEGFSGSTINRPRFKKLIKDIELKKIDTLVCYRLDRISRNVSDFSSTLELLQNYNVDFVSISEQFDTSTPMGKAMIYIASVFAQLERETIAERVRDNMLELAKAGRWTGGKIPAGFISVRKKYKDNLGLEREYSQLEIKEDEMSLVKLLYKKYLELGSLHKLEVYATQNELKSNNGIVFEKSTLKIILQNPIYVKSNIDVINYLESNGWKVYGESDNLHSLLTYNKTEQTIKRGKRIKTLKPDGQKFAAVSSIKGAIEPKLWLEVQYQFDKNRNTFPRLGKTHNALLTGKLKCGYCKEYMLVQHGRISKVTGEKLFYYMCSLKRKSHKKFCDNKNAKASEIESLVLLSLKKLGINQQEFINRIKNNYSSMDENNANNEKTILNKLLKEKGKQINNLLNILSKNQDIEDVMIEKIRNIKKECIEIKKKLSAIDNNAKRNKLNKLNLDLIRNLLSRCAIIDKLSRNEQKQIIGSLIDVIYWYGNEDNNGKISIKFIGTDDEDNESCFEKVELNFFDDKLQFRTPST
ncbi:recombinase family protein, partial [Clostridium sp. Mt-5]